MTDDFKRRKKATAEFAICSVLLRDVYSDIKTKKHQMQSAMASLISAAPQ